MNHPDRLDHYRSPAPNDTVGQALRELGFKTRRLNRGYQVAWNETQLTLLRRALNLRDPRIPA